MTSKKKQSTHPTSINNYNQLPFQNWLVKLKAQ